MKESEFIKKAIDENIADKDAIIFRTINSASRQYINKRSAAKKNIVRIGLAFGIVLIFLLGSVCVNIPLQWRSKNNETIGGTANNAPQKHNFTLVAYAMDNRVGAYMSKGPAVKQESKAQLTQGIKVKLPSGKIERGKYSSYIDENGTLHEGYEASFDWGAGFVCSGDGIESVTFTSINGELVYWDIDLAEELEAKGELYICSIPISETKIKPDGPNYEEIKKAFNDMWENGELDEYKNKYFGGENINLDDYRIEFRGSTYEDGTKDLFMIINDKNKAPYPYIKRGKTVEAKADVATGWIPEKAIEKVMAFEPLKYEELPGDTVTVTVKFKDGQIQTKTILISFDKEGNIIAEVK